MPSANNLQVLIVDDQMSMRQLIRYALERIGFSKITDARSGEEALRVLQTTKFDLVISDWNMEGMDGIDLLKQVRSDPLIKKTPFIMVTGQNTKEQVMEAIEAGVNNYVVKPLSADGLKKKIEAVIGKLT
jgi:two-component system chemotaxis response regulator CheY